MQRKPPRSSSPITTDMFLDNSFRTPRLYALRKGWALSRFGKSQLILLITSLVLTLLMVLLIGLTVSVYKCLEFTLTVWNKLLSLQQVR